MTSSANDKWDYSLLMHGIKLLRDCQDRYRSGTASQALTDWACRDIQHVIDFIEYNIEELEIHETNGD